MNIPKRKLTGPTIDGAPPVQTAGSFAQYHGSMSPVGGSPLTATLSPQAEHTQLVSAADSVSLPQRYSQLGQAEGALAQTDRQARGVGRINANGEYVVASHGAESGENHLQGECETCNNRKYVDGSHDGSVSFQTPTHIPPEQAAAKVMAHEQEHVVNEQLYAERDGREVISQNVQIFQDICPDCGASYVSGGLTTTVTAEKADSGQNEMDIVA